MNNFLASKKKPLVEGLPPWLITAPDSIKALYRAFITIESELTEKISKTTEELAIKERSIVKAKVAERAGVDESNFRKDRPISNRLLIEIENANERLNLLYKKQVSSRSEGQHKSKSELLAEVKLLRTEVSKLKNEKYQEFFSQLIANQLTEEQKNLAEKNRALAGRVKELEQVVSNLRNQIAAYIKELNA